METGFGHVNRFKLACGSFLQDNLQRGNDYRMLCKLYQNASSSLMWSSHTSFKCVTRVRTIVMYN
jgi:hypothetical protein